MKILGENIFWWKNRNIEIYIFVYTSYFLTKKANEKAFLPQSL